MTSDQARALQFVSGLHEALIEVFMLMPAEHEKLNLHDLGRYVAAYCIDFAAEGASTEQAGALRQEMIIKGLAHAMSGHLYREHLASIQPAPAEMLH